MSREDKDQPSVEVKGKNLVITMTLKWIGGILVTLCLTWNTAQIMMQAKASQSESITRKQDVVRSDADSKTIINGLGKTGELDKKLDALVTATANNTAAINACTVVNQELARTCEQLREDVRDLRKRVDDLYRKP